MLVKICGITRREDAEAAIELGANALGFVFWPKSPRYVDPEQARSIVGALPPFITTVGVFVDQTARLINGVSARVGLSAVQLHGDEPVAMVDNIERPVIKALAMSDELGADDADAWPERVRLLLDVHDPVQRGGTGRTVDWGRAAGLAKRRPGTAGRRSAAGKRRGRRSHGSAVRHRRVVRCRVGAGSEGSGASQRVVPRDSGCRT